MKCQFSGERDVMANTKYEIFLGVCRAGSFKAAAEELGYTQAGISYTVKALEEELGITLFYRRHGGVVLTPEGEAVYPAIASIVNEERHLGNLVGGLTGLEHGTLRISIFTSLYVNWYPDMLKAFGNLYPGIDLEAAIFDRAEDINEQLRNGAVDLAFCTRRDEHFEYYHLLDEPILAILPKDHPLLPLDRFPTGALDMYPYVYPGKSFDEIERILEERGVDPDTVIRSHTDYATLSLVAAGFGYTLLPRLFLQHVDFPVVTKQLEDPAYREILIGVRSKDTLTEAARRFIDFAADWCRENASGKRRRR